VQDAQYRNIGRPNDLKGVLGQFWFTVGVSSFVLVNIIQFPRSRKNEY
jgi:hypothetical protein